MGGKRRAEGKGVPGGVEVQERRAGHEKRSLACSAVEKTEKALRSGESQGRKGREQAIGFLGFFGKRL
jgi:hypothetical protein